MPRGCHRRAPTSHFLSHPRPWKCPRAAPGRSGSTRGPEVPGQGTLCQVKPCARSPAPSLPMQGPVPAPKWGPHPVPPLFTPPEHSRHPHPSPKPHPAMPQRGYFPSSPLPLPPPAPGGWWRRKDGAGGTSWSCGVPAGSPRPPVPVLPRLLAGPQARACSGPGHLVSGRGSAELRVAPTHAAAESPGTPSRGTGPAPAATGRREMLLVLRRGHGDGRAGCPRAAVPGQSHLRRVRTG